MAIRTKLLEFQKKGVKVERDASNPFFKSRYTSLNEVLEKVKKPLNDAGIVIVQSAKVDGIETRLIDTEDDSEVSSFIPFVAATDMQKLGGAISYARRYALIALLCLEDSDMDGEDAIPARGAEAINDFKI